jgi:hypothetical protein
MINKEISRDSQLLHKVIMIDGFPGCGKTMLSPIISAFPKVELMQYCFLIEQICELYNLKKIDTGTSQSMIRMNADLMIYDTMMARRANFRPSDLSSIFKNKPFKHFKRLFRAGDAVIPGVIKEEEPILHLTTHMLYPAINLLEQSLKDKLIFIEVVRHPLYMIIQHEMNIKNIDDPRFQHIRYKTDDKEYTFYVEGWENLFDRSNSFERAIYSMQWYFDKIDGMPENNSLFIPFELFVKSPDSYIDKIAISLASEAGKDIRKEMIKQKVPRKLLSDGPALDIYKRCGWVPPQSYSEEKELEIRRELVKANVSKEALDTLDAMCESYEKKFLSE